MQESDLLFPSETGGFRSPTVLDKPFKGICQHLSLGKKVTPKAMRRTFQDLARRAAVDGLVQRSICGHLTEEMTETKWWESGGKPITTPTIAAASSSQVPVTN